MIDLFQKILFENYPELSSKRLLLAVSGGIDSMVLLDLITKTNLDNEVAHCNFNLRGSESDDDQEFIITYCQERHIKLHIKSFDTQAYAQKHKLSIQLAARELRYNWFSELMNLHGYHFLLTAHHLDDNIETFLINLSRGTGLDGLLGIRKRENIIRPLLDFSRSQIEQYALENQIPWREDQSNASDKYLRNKIRHQIVPVLKELQPEFLSSFSDTLKHLSQVHNFAEEMAQKTLEGLLSQEDEFLRLNLTELLKTYHYQFLLYYWLRQYKFTAWKDIYALVYAQSGKQINSPTHRLLKNRNELLLTPLSNPSAPKSYLLRENEAHISEPLNLEIYHVQTLPEKIEANELFIDKKLLKFPLTIGKWKEGTYFYPFGMQRCKKKVSKFFKDQKFSELQKEKTWILYSEDQIVWIIGHRADERFSVTPNTTDILKIVLK